MQGRRCCRDVGVRDLLYAVGPAVGRVAGEVGLLLVAAIPTELVDDLVGAAAAEAGRNGKPTALLFPRCAVCGRKGTVVAVAVLLILASRDLGPQEVAGTATAQVVVVVSAAPAPVRTRLEAPRREAVAAGREQ